MHRLILWIAVVVVVLVVQRLHVFGRQAADTRATPTSVSVPHASELLPPRAHGRPRFRCDGRIYCSQMHSRAEAEYFIRHCPGTRMDGDNDGIPCENDSRF